MSGEKEDADPRKKAAMVAPKNLGRRAWADEAKLAAVRKVNVGAKVITVAREIGAHESLVARWVRDARMVPEAKPARMFVEAIMAPAEAARTPSMETQLEKSCVVRVGQFEVAVPPGFPMLDLTAIPKAVRLAQ